MNCVTLFLFGITKYDFKNEPLRYKKSALNHQ